MSRRKTGNATLEEIIRDAFEAGFRALDGDPAPPGPSSRKREPVAAEVRHETADLGEPATTLP